jgi:hypothetical protein
MRNRPAKPAGVSRAGGKRDGADAPSVRDESVAEPYQSIM